MVIIDANLRVVFLFVIVDGPFGQLVVELFVKSVEIVLFIFWWAATGSFSVCPIVLSIFSDMTKFLIFPGIDLCHGFDAYTFIWKRVQSYDFSNCSKNVHLGKGARLIVYRFDHFLPIKSDNEDKPTQPFILGLFSFNTGPPFAYWPIKIVSILANKKSFSKLCHNCSELCAMSIAFYLSVCLLF